MSAAVFQSGNVFESLIEANKHSKRTKIYSVNIIENRTFGESLRLRNWTQERFVFLPNFLKGRKSLFHIHTLYLGFSTRICVCALMLTSPPNIYAFSSNQFVDRK